MNDIFDHATASDLDFALSFHSRYQAEFLRNILQLPRYGHLCAVVGSVSALLLLLKRIFGDIHDFPFQRAVFLERERVQFDSCLRSFVDPADVFRSDFRLQLNPCVDRNQA